MKARFENAGLGPITLIASGGGVFEIAQSGPDSPARLLYSKKSTGRFPHDAELTRIVDSCLNGLFDQ